MFLFLLMAGYLIWFNAIKRTEINENVYNTKQDTASDRIIRGSILTEDGTVLAYTDVDTMGNERRIYPEANVFAHVIGYATNGKSGLEATENNVLMDSNSSLWDKLRNVTDSDKVQGDSVVVTLSPKLQRAAYNALGSYKGAVVVMEPDSGRILAMVSKPDFDPNTISENWDAMVSDADGSALLNRAVQGLYPPGSTFKILTTLAYLRAHPNDYENFSIDCTGVLTQGETTITCYDSEQHGYEDLKAAFANSCNTAFSTIGLGLDNDSFRKLAEDFLFNSSLPTEIMHNKSSFTLDHNSSVEKEMTTAIGQGDTLVTPLHMAMITSTVANGGVMMRPYFVSGVQTYDGDKVSENKPRMYDQLMTVDEAEVLTSYMEATVTQGTGYGLRDTGYSVAGKTGSAEYETGGEIGTHSWFVGFSGVDDPDIVVAVIAEDGGTGSSTAVPIARAIFDTYYYS